MFASERIRIIKKLLLDKKHVDVANLSSMFDVSEVTVRRDLEKLEKENFLVRTHGGAVLNDDYIKEPAEDSEETLPEILNDPLYEEKNEISSIAVSMIENEDIILLAPGNINLLIARKLLQHKNLTVLTSDFRIAAELSANPHIKVILPGGDLDPKTLTLSGKLTEETIMKFFVNKAFIEVDGVSFQRGFTINSIDKACILREMSKISNELIILCAFTAFNHISFAQFGSLLTPQKMISNPNIPDEFKKYFFENNIPLFTSFEDDGG
jgi:DeoR family fructose operon transcriptional repressor